MLTVIYFEGGRGYSHIKRAPAFTFGHLTPVTKSKPLILNSAPMLDTSGMGPKGTFLYKPHYSLFLLYLSVNIKTSH